MTMNTQTSQKQEIAMALLRLITGMLVAWHGLELWEPKTMAVYMSWEQVQKLPAAKWMVIGGKVVELLGGILLALGWYTRLAGTLIALVMLFICFYIGEGRFWNQDQHPFLLAMIAALYAVSGSGRYSIDHRMVKIINPRTS